MEDAFTASLPGWTANKQQDTDVPIQIEQQHLPWELWVQILQHVDLSHRLGTCTSVSSAWHTAAVAATHTIQHRSRSSASTAGLQDWLTTYGSHLHSVQLSAAYHSTEEDLQLTSWDCPRLRTVSLSHITLTHLDTPVTFDVSSSSSISSSPGVTASDSDTEEQPNSIQQSPGFSVFTNLTSLALQYCCLSSLSSLAAVTGLSHLRLEKPQPPGFSFAAAAYTLDAAPLASLQKLTSLQVVKGCYRGLLLTACQLTNLQGLQLTRCKDTGATIGVDSGQLWQQLLGLTSLHIDAVPGLLLLPSRGSSDGSSSGSSSRGSTGQPLQRLQMLEVITAAGIDPMLLSAARGLQHLHLTSTPLIGGPAGTASLLSSLSQMTKLRYLNLRGTLQHAAAGVAYPVPAANYSAVAAAVAAAVAERAVTGAGTQGVAAGAVAAAAVVSPAAGYAALTASSRLQYLDLSRCVLPPDAVPALFAGSSSSSSTGARGKASSSSSSRLPHLQHLLLADTFHTAADMPLLVSACPSLQKLDIVRATPYDSPLPADTLSALAQLQHLTNLSLCNVDDAAAIQLARLTNLESLSVVWQSSISDEGVQELTALRRLTQLWLHGSLSRRLAPGYLLSLQSQVLPPNVWCQLGEACSTADAQQKPEAPQCGYTPQQLLTLS